jgi:subfamily B ATP-binding cassette protein MsbA
MFKKMKFLKKINFKSEDLTIIKRLVKSYIKPLIPSFVLGISLMICVAVATSSYAYLVKNVMDEIFVKKDTSMLFLLPFVVIIITFAKNIALYFQMVVMQLFSLKITIALQKDIFAALLNLDLKKFNKMHTGRMLAIVTTSVAGISNGLNLIFTVLIREVLTISLLVGIMFYNNLELALLSAISVPLIFVPLIRIAKRIKKLTGSSLVTGQGLVSSLDDSLKSIRLIKTYGTEEYEKSRIGNVLNQIFSLQKTILRTANLSGPLVECISVIGIALVIWYGGSNVISGKTTPGTFFAFFISMTIAYKPFKSLANLNVTIQMFLVASRQFFEIMDTKPEIFEIQNPINIKNFKGKVEFTNVNFTYNLEDATLKKTLDNINLIILPKSKTAFVGPTGAGKSTIISLIMRLYDPTSGKILIDDVDLKDLTFKLIREKISYVGQDIQLFDDTIANNIRYSKPHASMEEVQHAVKLANALEFIEKMPQGFETMIGQSGVNLSGGQKQRLSIARAILKNSEIIILDEPTSALDAISEELIRKSLEIFTQNKTVIVIAHRLSTVIDSNCIYVVEDGKITESGTHFELIEKDGHYSHLYKTQFGVK